MKKIICLMLCLLMIIGAAGCSDSSPAPDPSAVSPQTNPQTEPAEDTDIQNEYRTRIKMLIESSGITPTEKPSSLYAEGETLSSKAESRNDLSISFALAQICSDANANPIAVFGALVKDGWYKKTGTETDGLVLDFSTASDYNHKYFFKLDSLSFDIMPKSYEYTDAGCRTLINDILALSTVNNNAGSVFLTAFRENDSTEDAPQVYYSEDDDCYYAYALYYNDGIARFLSMYLRSSDGETVSDVEFQLLNTVYPYENAEAGIGIMVNAHSNDNLFCTASLMTVTEQLLTGKAYLDIDADRDLALEILNVPSEYTVGEYNVSVNYEEYEPAEEKDVSFGEKCDITTYRISKGL